MSLYRGTGGAGDSTTDASITAVTLQATNAAASASSATASAAEIKAVTATATTLAAGTSATAGYTSATGVLAFGIPAASASDGVTTLEGLTDVDISTVPPTDGQALSWDNAASQWEPATSSIGNLSDGFYSNRSLGLGSSALAQDDGGYRHNVAVGHTAAYKTSSGSGNTAVGSTALYNNILGTNNTAIGSKSLNNSIGTSNTAVGRMSLYNLYDGTTNIGIGNDSGDAITTGSNNTIIGSLAGTSAMSDTVLIGAGTTERMRIDSSGNVLIGTTTAGGAGGVSISGTGYVQARVTSDATAYFDRLSSDGDIVKFQKDGTTVGSIGVDNGNNLIVEGSVALHAGLQFGTSTIYPRNGGADADGVVSVGGSTSKFKDLHLSGQVNTGTVVTTGNVGIGTSSPSDKLSVGLTSDGVGNIANFAASGFTTRLNHGSLGANAAHFYTGGATSLSLGTNSTERMRIDSLGNVLIGTTSNTATGTGLYGYSSSGSYGRINFQANTDSGTLYRLRFYNNAGTAIGSITTNGSTTSYVTSSDYRLKTDVQPMTGATATFKLLKPVNFEWIADGTRVDGFLAHELQEVIPAAATGSKDAMRDEEYTVTEATDTEEAVMGTRSVPDIQGIDQAKVVPLLVATVQELLARIEALEV